MASENGENSIDDRDLDNDADFLQNRGFSKGYDSIRSMFLHNSDHPGMVLVTAPLTGSNYLTWSGSMKIALIAKQKLGFVNGKCVQPDMNSKEYEGWLRADSMVISWILNSISKDIVDAFLYANTAKELWDELGERFGECNGPLIYQIQREIASISQGTMSVSQYYIKLKKAWDELNCLMLVPNCSCRPCTCGNVKAVASILSNNQIMQFLMGLNESFDSVRSQILRLDPLPSVNKVYSMVLRIEKQREVSDLFTENLENTAMFARSPFTKPAGRSHGYSRTDRVHPKGPTRGQVHSSSKGYGSQSDSKKPFRHCDYCNNDGHVRDACFRHGYPWHCTAGSGSKEDTSLPSDFQKKGAPLHSRQFQPVQSSMDDDITNRRTEQDNSEMSTSLGTKSVPPHLREHECEDRTDKYEPDYSSLPTQFGRKSMPPRSRMPQRGQPYYKHDVGFGKSEYPRGLQEFEPFDICKSDVMSPVNLNSPLPIRSSNKRNEINHSVEGTKHKVLRPGMVLLKGYISDIEQIKMVKKCRDLGVRPGGFYRPGYQDGAKLRLQMMCLGLNWDPQTRKYEMQHPLDGSEPPGIPHEFCALAERAIQDSQSLIKANTGVDNVENILPRMSPNICIVNFYTTSGRLGLHQDRDESRESLFKGLPVVSFSLGDSAEFLYGDQRNVDAAQRIVLESGDVLIFGGNSRNIFHGVSSIIPNTAPNSLLEETNLLPGRLNLTIRQF